MNFNSLNKIFEDKFTISKHLLKEEASLKSKKEESKKKLTESIDRNLTERDWKLTIPGSFRDDMLNAGEEEDFDKVKNILIDMCNYVLEHIDESNFDLDDQEYVIEEFEDFIEELEYVDFEDEDEANYYLNDLYDLLDNTDIFLGLRESLNEETEKFIITKVGDGLYALAQGNPPVINDRKKIEANSFEEAKEILLNNGYSEDELVIDESLKEEKITGGDMEQEDINIIQPLIDDFDSLEDANKDALSITWNFGRRNSDNKMTAGVDIYFLAKGSEENLQPYLKQVEDIILSDGYKFDDSLGYDLDPWKAHIFGDGYHTQIIEDVGEVIEESFGYKPSFDEWYFQETGVNTSDLTDEQYDELWADEDLMNHYRKFCDSLDECLNESGEKRKYIVYFKVGPFRYDATDSDVVLAKSEEDAIRLAKKHVEKDGIWNRDGKGRNRFSPNKSANSYRAEIFNESLNKYEKDLESGYYPDEWDIDFEDELENLGIEPQRGVYVGYQYRVPNRRFASKMVRLAKEFGYDDSWVEGNILYLKWSRPEREYHKGPYDECLTEDTIKQDGKWVNKGKEGTHGKFKTKKEADAQRRAMFASGFKG